MKVIVVVLLTLILAIVAFDGWHAHVSRAEVSELSYDLSTQMQSVSAAADQIEQRLTALEGSVKSMEENVLTLTAEQENMGAKLSAVSASTTKLTNSISTISLVLSKMKVQLDKFFYGDESRRGQKTGR